MFDQRAADWAKEALGAGVMSVGVLAESEDDVVLRLETIDNRSVVLRRYQPGPESSARAAGEVACLRVLAGSGVPVPELIAADLDGQASGVPSVLVDFVPGRALAVLDADALTQVDTVLERLAAVAPPPELPGTGTVLVHGALSPRRLLWAGGHLTAVLGWGSARAGSSGEDRLHLRGTLGA